jgi:hypothetical protein
MATCSPSELLASAACFACLTEKELDAIAVSLLQSWAGEEQTPAQLIEAAKCFTCLDHKQLSTIQAQLLCDIAG